MKSNLCSRESSVFRLELGFESTANLCINGTSVGVFPWGCSYIKGSVTHSLTLPISFSFKIYFLSRTSVQS